MKPRLHLPITAAGLLTVMGFVCTPPVAAQRISVADRVALLEQRAIEADAARAAAVSANIETLNQITALRTELRDLRGQIETLQQRSEHLQSTLRSQFMELDERLQALEHTAEPAETDAGELDAAASQEIPSPPAQSAAPVPVPSTAQALEDDAEVSADAADPAPDPAQERAAYERAFERLKSGRYVEATRLFQVFLQTFPDGVYAANARYWLGESYYVVEDYTNAQAQFEALIARWPGHDKTPGALLKIGLSQHGRKQYDEAEATLREVAQRYPDTDAAAIAAVRLRAIELSRLN